MEPLKHVKPKAIQLTPEQRGKRVVASQRGTSSLYATLPAEVQAKLAALCNEDGTFVQDTRIKAGSILAAYYESQKAVVDSNEPSQIPPPVNTTDEQ